mmetsp:Transcript_19998/g.29925  ORF Transcript_19998/g.29925 Transcript_19998/m.29925 type:complete len:203 (-) Transcript_19998:114-722(-)
MPGRFPIGVEDIASSSFHPQAQQQHEVHHSTAASSTLGPTSFQAKYNGVGKECMHQERPCPEVSLSAAAPLNARLGSRCSQKSHQDCCHAISRSGAAALRAERLIEKNFYLKYLAAAPLDPEPVVSYIWRWLKAGEAQGGSDLEEDQLRLQNGGNRIGNSDVAPGIAARSCEPAPHRAKPSCFPEHNHPFFDGAILSSQLLM